jgi:hypothetical protein
MLPIVAREKPRRSLLGAFCPAFFTNMRTDFRRFPGRLPPRADRARDAHVGMSRGVPDLGQRPAARQRVACEGVAAVVDGERPQPGGAQDGRKAPFSGIPDFETTCRNGAVVIAYRFEGMLA